MRTRWNPGRMLYIRRYHGAESRSDRQPNRPNNDVISHSPRKPRCLCERARWRVKYPYLILIEPDTTIAVLLTVLRTYGSWRLQEGLATPTIEGEAG
jgi:hypothetical protein